MGILFLLFGIGFLVLCGLSATGELPRNRLAGMRTRTTLASDAAWSAAHRASAWSLGASGAICCATAALSVTSLDSGDEYTVATIAAICVGVVLIVGGMQANAAARRAS